MATKTSKAQLFFANCTMNRKEFQYRKPEDRRQQLVPVKLGPLEQKELPHRDMQPDDLKRIAEQQEIYDWLHVSEAKRQTKVIHVLYDFKEIDQSVVDMVRENNKKILAARGEIAQKQNLMAANHSLLRRTEGKMGINAMQVLKMQEGGKSAVVQSLRPAGAKDLQ